MAAGVWRWADYLLPHVPAHLQVSLGEGDTPLVEAPELARDAGLECLALKREDLNPCGSHKARGAAFQVAAHRAAGGGEWLVVSSSGNAAVAAAAYAGAAGLRLVAFVAPGTHPVKLAALRDFGAHVFFSERALTLAEEAAEALGAPNLRPSTHQLATVGYRTLGWELAEGRADDTDLFVFASSGASFVGLGEARASAAEVIGRPWPVRLHAVQGLAAAPIAGPLDTNRAAEREAAEGSRSALGALGARKTRRAAAAQRVARDSGGGGWTMTDDEALAGLALLGSHGFDTSLEGGAAFAGACRAAREVGVRRAMVVLTGHASQRVVPASATEGRTVDSLDEVLAALGVATG